MIELIKWKINERKWIKRNEIEIKKDKRNKKKKNKRVLKRKKNK